MGFSAVLECHKTGYTTSEIPDLTGKVAIVTGGSSGIGQETSLELCRKGAHVIVATRSKERAQEAIDAIQKTLDGKAKIEFLKLDLMDLAQVKEAAQEFLKKDIPLDILVNNAGVFLLMIL